MFYIVISLIVDNFNVKKRLKFKLYLYICSVLLLILQRKSEFLVRGSVKHNSLCHL